MTHHINDGRVWAVDTYTGEKRRVMPAALKYAKNLQVPPSARTEEQRETSRRSRRRRRLTEPDAPASEVPKEPDVSQTEPDTDNPGPTPDHDTTEGI